MFDIIILGLIFFMVTTLYYICYAPQFLHYPYLSRLDCYVCFAITLQTEITEIFTVFSLFLKELTTHVIKLYLIV